MIRWLRNIIMLSLHITHNTCKTNKYLAALFVGLVHCCMDFVDVEQHLGDSTDPSNFPSCCGLFSKEEPPDWKTNSLEGYAMEEASLGSGRWGMAPQVGCLELEFK